MLGTFFTYLSRLSETYEPELQYHYTFVTMNIGECPGESPSCIRNHYYRCNQSTDGYPTPEKMKELCSCLCEKFIPSKQVFRFYVKSNCNGWRSYRLGYCISSEQLLTLHFILFFTHI